MNQYYPRAAHSEVSNPIAIPRLPSPSQLYLPVASQRSPSSPLPSALTASPEQKAMAARAAFLLLALLVPAVMGESSVMQKLQSSQFTGFMRLLEHADLIPEIEAASKSEKGVTIFCPTDDALMYHTSPTLLAFLKTKENKATLRKVLLNHVVVERLSPFQWEGAHATLDGSKLQLSMDAQAFYAGSVAVMQYNALVSGDAAVHSIPTLILPAGLSTAAGNVEMFVEEGTEVRRMLAAGAPAPGPSYSGPSTPGSTPPKSAGSLVGSVFTVAAAALVAVLAL